VARATWTAIPNFVDTAQFARGQGDAMRDELGVPRDALVVMTAAAIKRGHKRIDCLVREFGELRRRRPELPAWLVVAGGRDAETDELIEWGQGELGDRVRFLPSFPRERMPELYRAADLFVLCSLKEMMPIALLEATASGLPCLVNKHPVLEWMIGRSGESIGMSVSGALSAAMECWLCDGGRRKAAGELARSHCETHFSRDAVTEQLLRYYGQVIAARVGRGITASSVIPRAAI
jgi:glycosyltransferase involved in cell wall biosynthesis